VLGLTIVVSCSCGGRVQRQLVFEKTIALPAGRFTGPVEVEVPRKVDDPFVVYEIRASLTAACAPRLRIEFPDGESQGLGPGKRRWQELLALRAKGEPAPSTDAGTPAAGALDAGPPTEQTGEDAEEREPVAEPAPQRGRWHAVATDSWPGQLEYQDLRASLCASVRTWTTHYDTALDENGRIAIWADVPQELEGASLRIRIVEATDVDARLELASEIESKHRSHERAVAKRQRRAQERRRKEEERRRRRAAKPRPPKPSPKSENPGPPKAEGALWVSGQWVYSEQRGHWVWVGGHWQRPAAVPADEVENPGEAPVPGCRWQAGHWVWIEGSGTWQWERGYWLAPPPKVENPGPPPVPESPWVPGHWISSGATFEWIAGHWDTPRPRTEVVPPPPFAGAQWRAGLWIKVGGQWKWSPGYYEDASRKPPRPKAETPGPKPHPDAVWLAGFWRWSAAHSQHQWVAGHWEVPPGEGYVWVPDPPDPHTGVSVHGNWKLRIEIDVKVKK